MDQAKYMYNAKKIGRKHLVRKRKANGGVYFDAAYLDELDAGVVVASSVVSPNVSDGQGVINCTDQPFHVPDPVDEPVSFQESTAVSGIAQQDFFNNGAPVESGLLHAGLPGFSRRPISLLQPLPNFRREGPPKIPISYKIPYPIGKKSPLLTQTKKSPTYLQVRQFPWKVQCQAQHRASLFLFTSTR